MDISEDSSLTIAVLNYHTPGCVGEKTIRMKDMDMTKEKINNYK